MKNKKPIFIVLLIVLLTQLACGQTLTPTNTLSASTPEPTAAPEGIFSKAYDPQTGTTYQIVPQFRDLSQPYPTDFELIPITPPSEQEISSILSEWNINPDEEVGLLFLDSTWYLDNEGNIVIQSINVDGLPVACNFGGKVAAPSPQNNCNLDKARAFAVHMWKRMMEDGWKFTFLVDLISDLAAGKISSEILAQNGNELFVKTTFQGKSILIILGKGATMYIPSSGAKVSSVFKGLNKQLGMTKRVVKTLETVSAFFTCVKDNWPSTREQVNEAVEAHDRVYKRAPGEEPKDFPTSIPITLADGTSATVSLVDAKAYQFNNSSIIELTDEEMITLAGVGMITVAVIVAPEIAIPSFGLVWASGAVH